MLKQEKCKNQYVFLHFERQSASKVTAFHQTSDRSDHAGLSHYQGAKWGESQPSMQYTTRSNMKITLESAKEALGVLDRIQSLKRKKKDTIIEDEKGKKRKTEDQPGAPKDKQAEQRKITDVATQTSRECLSDAYLYDEREKANSFFQKLPGNKHGNLAILVVAHLFPGADVFLDAIKERARLIAIIPKTQSRNSEIIQDFREKGYNIQLFDKEQCIDGKAVAAYLKQELRCDEKLIINDHGGYFSSSITQLHKDLDGRILGVVENTANGHYKYHEQKELPLPIMSVALSELKRAMEPAVGVSVKRAAEDILADNTVVLKNKKSVVFGFGSVGQKVANELGEKTMVFDTDPIAITRAYYSGYNIVTREKAFKKAEIIFCATGRKSIRKEDYEIMRRGCFIATVTSPDDELEMPDEKDYNRIKAGKNLYKYVNKKSGHYIYMMNDGNTVNFTKHQPAINPAILLVQGLEIRSFQEIYFQHAKLSKGLQDTPRILQEEVAKAWNQLFV